MKKKILISFGTRPELIKLISLILYLKKRRINVILCNTSQHKELIAPLIKFYSLKINYDLKILKKNQSLSELNAKLIVKFNSLLLKVKPDCVVVQGDTSTAYACALTSFYNKVKLFHVEAGLRTGNIYAPWPEEINRIFISKLASHHFAPTKEAKRNLINENISISDITITGNTVIDALFQTLKKIKKDKRYSLRLAKKYKFLKQNTFKILITIHRRENFGEPLKNILQAINKISKYKNVQIIYSVHKNPNVLLAINKYLKRPKNLKLTNSLNYIDFVYLMNSVDCLISDSGGIQEEAPSLGKPNLVLRDFTERPEAIKHGSAILVGTKEKNILITFDRIFNDKSLLKKMSKKRNLYGSGDSSAKIAKIILNNI